MDAPAVAVGPDDKRFAVAWMDLRRGRQERDVFWSVAPSISFGAEKRLSARDEDLQGHPTLAVDAFGTAYAAWEDGRDGTQRIHLARSDRPGVDERVSTEQEGTCLFPVLSSRGGRTVLVYLSEADGRGAVLCRTISGGSR
jgi:hypothetical protein